MAADCEQLTHSGDAIPTESQPDRRVVAYLHAIDGRRRSEKVPIRRLVAMDSPRLDGADQAHVQRLVEAGDELPPILVHRPTMRIIDGLHRVRAAVQRGRDEIEAIFYDGTLESAFVLAVELNIRHGLPLSLSDRRAAAARIIETHGAWSDRMIARTTGLSARTVRAIRLCTNAESARSNVRIGADGRVRPLTSAHSRRMAAEIIASHPEASLRQVAKAVGISPGTVRDVRDRLRRGEDPVPRKRTSKPARPRTSATAGAEPEPPVDVAQVLHALGRDPSLRLNAGGRELLRWLHLHAVDMDDCSKVVQAAPAHCVGVVAELARGCAQSWSRISVELAKRVPD
ncbi:ParB/RepB/Spo0J family partition protein [Nocardia transvalensis]|uniref:ParB/RepB/Spo0J family partition protein n=1 Tax=Nocardia transvalensis TaxID=37333 RepID=UPI00189573E0|nr:ParB N-terminal domain-containing protein [Nocardia transvalensis]MBF6332827.1 ParB N-terminal domain-containing protein [Nocardia transvalensis]